MRLPIGIAQKNITNSLCRLTRQCTEIDGLLLFYYQGTRDLPVNIATAMGYYCYCKIYAVVGQELGLGKKDLKTVF